MTSGQKTNILQTILQAQQIITNQALTYASEAIPILKAYNRVLAENIYADRDYPPFNRSMMDGYAVRSVDVNEGITHFKILEEVHAGFTARQALSRATAIKIMTGAPVPPSADAVIRVEDAIREGDTVSFTISSAKKWKSIAQKGEDTKQNALVAQKGEICTAAVISVLAVVGKSIVKVVKPPSLSIISTGDEVMPIDVEILPHQIRESNSYALRMLFKQYGIEPQITDLVKDNKAALKAAIQRAFASDIVVLSGGVSMGDADFVPEVLVELGAEKLFHKVKIKPGKPLWFGKQPNEGVAFGLPGNPMSCQVGFKVFIEPFLRKKMGLSPVPVLQLPFQGQRNARSSFDEYFPCKFVAHNGQTHISTYNFKSSGDIAAMLRSDGLAIHPARSKALEGGEILNFLPWKSV